MDTILKTTALCKKFKKQTTVDNVSLEIERNTVYGLLGPNGAGKSTTLKMITGILKPTSGTMEFNGHLWKREDLYAIGALIETPPLYENLTAYENLKVRTTLLGQYLSGKRNICRQGVFNKSASKYRIKCGRAYALRRYGLF